MAIFDNLKNQTDIYDPLVQQTLIEEIPNNSIADVIGVIIDIDQERRTIQQGLWNRLKLKRASRFDWDDARSADGVPILARQGDNLGKVNHRSHTTFDKIIVQNKSNYLTGKGLEFEGEPDQVALDWLESVQFDTMLSELSQDATGMGEAFTLLYSPEGVNEALMSKEQPYYCVVIYDQDTGLPKYGLLYYQDLLSSPDRIDPNNSDNDNLVCYWYTETTVTKYTGAQGSLIAGEEMPHLFAGVPLVEWRNNSERLADTEKVVGLMDLYDITDSDLLSEISQLRLAYFLLKGFGLDNGSDLMSESIAAIPGFADQSATVGQLIDHMKKAGVFMSDNPEADASFINKNINIEAVKYAKDSLRQRIFQMAGSYDPVSFTDGQGGNVTAFQIQMQLFGIEQASVETEMQFRKAFDYMMTLVQGYYAQYRNMSFEIPVPVFKRNLPSNTIQDLKDAMMAGVRIDNATKLSLLPFDVDREAVMQALEAESQAMFETPMGESDDTSDL